MEIQTTLVSQATDIEKGEFYKKNVFTCCFCAFSICVGRIHFII